jgi:DNA-binding XRE family transcriptional regulator
VRLLEAGEISVSLVTISRVLSALGTTCVELGPGRLCPCFDDRLRSPGWTIPFDDTDLLLTTLGRAIASTRRTRGLTQEQLAELAGLHPHTVGEVERGSMNATIATLFALYTALGVRMIAPADSAHGLRLMD